MRTSVLVPFSILGFISFVVACSSEQGERGPRGVRGDTGPSGDVGGAGPEGPPGEAGPIGLSVLVRTAVERAGEHCTAGGQRIDVGLDRDADGELDESEVTSISYLCDGVEGASGVDGVPGTPGVNGVSGADGAPGTNGAPGADGTDGEPGLDGAPGADGVDGTDGAPGTPGVDGLSALVRVRKLLSGTECALGGRAVELGVDSNRNSVLDDVEVHPEATIVACNTSPVWLALPELPRVGTVYSFALARNDVDGFARLGFNFTDPAYRQEIIDVLWDGGGVYSGAQAYVTYQLDTSGVEPRWQPYEGRLTPQYYRYSELVFDAGVSYYTTNYSSFGGLIAVIRGGGAGSYALTPAFTGTRAHSLAFYGGQLFSLVAQSSGLTLSSYPIERFGSTFPNYWTNLVTLVSPASGVRSPVLLQAGSHLVAAYIQGTGGGSASIRSTTAPASSSAPGDLEELGTCINTIQVKLGYGAGYLYAACLDASGVLDVNRLELGAGGPRVWEDVLLIGSVDDFDLAADDVAVSLALRQDEVLRVYDAVGEPEPSFERSLPGAFDLERSAQGVVLSVCDETGDRTLRTFVR